MLEAKGKKVYCTSLFVQWTSSFKKNFFHLPIHKFINQYLLNENCLLKLVFQTMPIPSLKCHKSVRCNSEFSFTRYQISFSLLFSLPE